MKNLQFSLFLRSLCGGLAMILLNPGYGAVNTVGYPNILWRAKINGQNKLWFMNGSAYESETPIMPTSPPDHNWKITGVADFDGSGTADIIWQHETLDINAVWIMNGTAYSTAFLLQTTGDRNWDMAAVADFNGDGKADIIWQYRNSTMVAVWLMNGTGTPIYAALLNAQPNDANWRVVGAGDFNNDGVPDLIWRNRVTGQNVIWYMGGGSQGVDMTGGAEINTVEFDQDWRICGTGDFNNDSNADLLWRYTTLGVNAIWFMNNANLDGATYVRDLTDPAWEIATQDTSQSTWRMQVLPPDMTEALTAAVGSSSVTLNYSLALSGNNGVTIHRREPPATAWGNPLVSGYQPGVPASSYSDGTALGARLYEYRIFREGTTTHQRIMSGSNVPAIESRGRLVLLIDQDLAPYLGASLTTLREDLIGDGWTVAEYFVPRQDDTNTSNGDAINKANRDSIAATIGSEYVNNQAKGVFIIGHVTIPYSGLEATDGHQWPNDDHQGAWAADMYYADIHTNLWTDSTVNYSNSNHAENWNVPNDGKLDQDTGPSDLELFVGRIDFARIPTFNTGDTAGAMEGFLIQQYIAKSHRYRHKQSPFPTRDLSVTFGSFEQGHPLNGTFASENQQIYSQAILNSAALFGGGLEKVWNADPYFQVLESYAFGFAAGKAGSPDVINNEYANANKLFLKHTTADLGNGVIEAPIVFYELLGSWFVDWNLQNDFMRATLATPNYGLAVVWSRFSKWRFYPMAMGFPIGSALLSTCNEIEKNRDRDRYLAILGDPTLRLPILAPPTSAFWDAGNTQVKWTASAEDNLSDPNDVTYLVEYSTTGIIGTWSFLGTTTSVSIGDASSGSRTYRVRAEKLASSGSGSFFNISQGSFANR